jgi:hypothetical protein
MLDPTQITRLQLDRNPDDLDQILPCFMCGRRMPYRNGRFCCDRCRDHYDAGHDPGSLHPETTYHWRDGTPMLRGADGFLISCAHCRKKFDSKGLRCCSVECERAYCQQQDNLTTLVAAGIAPATKRQCEQCGVQIPGWRNGRRVSGKTKFCSDRCRLKALRNDLSASGGGSSRNPVLKRLSAKKGP